MKESIPACVVYADCWHDRRIDERGFKQDISLSHRASDSNMARIPEKAR